jgi:YVTN family beta-propeller protein
MKAKRLMLTAAALAGMFFYSCNNDDDQPFDPGVSVSTPEDTYPEGSGPIAVTFTTTDTFNSDVLLTYEITGSAVPGVDYQAPAGSVTLSAGELTATENIVLLDNDEVQPEREMIITITAVDGGTDFIGSPSAVTLTLTDNDAFPFENGILVLHEGNFFGGNASVSFVSEDLGTVTNGIFSEVNGRPLGDVAQSMAFLGDLAYIVVNNSQTVEVVNRYTMESEATVDGGLLNPRYMAFANGKGYVTNLGDGTNPDDDFVAVIDLESHTVESTIPVPEGPEWILADGNTLYVAHQGGFNQNNIVSVIGAGSNSIEATIPVADRPNSMQLIGNALWVLSGGNPAFTGNETAGQLDRINTATGAVEATFAFGVTDHPNYLSADGDTLYYLLNGEVFALNTSDTTLPEVAEISGVFFYDMTVSDGRLYGVDAADFVSNGSLQVYNLSDNALVGSQEVSIIPGGVYFNGDFEF